MPNLPWRLALLWLLVAFFALTGPINLRGSKPIIDDFVRWGYPSWFHIVTGILEIATAVLLAFPATRVLGAGLGCCVMLAAAGTVIFHGEYAHAIPAIVVLILTALVARS